MKNLAIIPARSGSKGLKDKNIKLLDDKPLIAYTIEAAVLSGVYSRILVSTDSQEYAEISEKFGASVPFLRSEKLASDTANTEDVVKDVINKLIEKGEYYDTLTILQPTSPLRRADDIVKGYDYFREKKAEAIVAVCEVDHSPLWTNLLPEDYSLEGFLREDVKGKRRQALPEYYRINGALYIVNVDWFMAGNSMYGEKCFGYVMEKKYSVDIDDEVDFALAEALIKR